MTVREFKSMLTPHPNSKEWDTVWISCFTKGEGIPKYVNLGCISPYDTHLILTKYLDCEITNFLYTQGKISLLIDIN